MKRKEGKDGMRKLVGASLLIAVFPSNVWAFVSHDYPPTFVTELARIFFLLSCILVLGAVVQNLLYKDTKWRYFFYSLIFFILWDIVVLVGQMAEHWVDPAKMIGTAEGWSYFTRVIAISGKDYIFYFAKYDYILINIAIFLFHRGLKQHLNERKDSAIVLAVTLPLFPILIVEMGGAVVFLIFSTMSLITSLKLHKRERTNILWNYMIWLSSAFVIFAISRSIGHIIKHILLAAGHAQTWQHIAPISSSFNLIALFLVGSLSLFFIRIYDIHMKVLKDKQLIENMNTELVELNQEFETIITERTMSLMALTVADKVRNPAAMIGILCKRVLSNKEELTLLNDVISECEKLQGIVGDFENLLRTKKSLFKYEDINDIVRSVVSVAVKEADNKKIHVMLHLSEEMLKVNAQKSLLRVAIFHVIQNAVDASQAGGTITITSSRRGDYIIITVSDTGSGIKQEEMDRIFNVFYSTKLKRFGMGLPLAKQIVSEHLGEITIESRERQGMTVIIKLPGRWRQEEKNRFSS